MFSKGDILRKIYMLAFSLLVLLTTTASAGTWVQVAKDTDMKIGENFTLPDGVTIRLSDISVSDKKITAALFDVYKENVRQETIVSYLSKPVELDNNCYRVTLVNSKNNKVFCAVDKKNIPVFEIASETVTAGTVNKTTVYAKLKQASATDIKVSWEISEVKIKKPASKSYGTLKYDTELDKTVLKWSGSGKIYMKVTYKDADKESYTQMYDVIQNSVVVVPETSFKESKELQVKKAEISEAKITAEKVIFKKAITRALKYINFSEETKTDLNRILSEI